MRLKTQWHKTIRFPDLLRLPQHTLILPAWTFGHCLRCPLQRQRHRCTTRLFRTIGHASHAAFTQCRSYENYNNDECPIRGSLSTHPDTPRHVCCAGARAPGSTPGALARDVLLLHVAGEIPDITLQEVVAYMLPGSDQSMRHLIARRNPFAVIRNARTSQDDIEAGATIFLNHCSFCHGTDGTGSQAAPELVGREYTHGDSDWAMYRTIRDGVAGAGMPATPDLSEDQRWQVISFVRSLDAAKKANATDAAERPAIRVTASFAEIAAKAQPDADWLTYSGSYAGTRHSSLHGIDRTNVNRLALKWLHQFETKPVLEVTPLVRNGVMFVSPPGCAVQALDAATGRTVWSWKCTLKDDLGENWVDPRAASRCSTTRSFSLRRMRVCSRWMRRQANSCGRRSSSRTPRPTTSRARRWRFAT